MRCLFHRWNGCQCVKCSRVRDAEHDLQIRERADFVGRYSQDLSGDGSRKLTLRGNIDVISVCRRCNQTVTTTTPITETLTEANAIDEFLALHCKKGTVT